MAFGLRDNVLSNDVAIEEYQQRFENIEIYRFSIDNRSII